MGMQKRPAEDAKVIAASRMAPAQVKGRMNAPEPKRRCKSKKAIGLLWTEGCMKDPAI
jgi:hypothetical protein